MAVANTLLNWAQLTLRYEILLLQHIFFHLPYRQEGEDHGLFPDDKWYIQVHDYTYMSL